MNLDGRNRVLEGQPASDPQYTEAEQSRIWDGLQNLASEGRLRLIKEVKEELKRLHPDALARLVAFPLTRMAPKGSDLRRRYQELTAKHPDLIPDEDLIHDPADPWLVVAAQKYGYTVLTDEVSSSEKTTRIRHGPQLPDLCDEEAVLCINLGKLANQEKWLD